MSDLIAFLTDRQVGGGRGGVRGAVVGVLICCHGAAQGACCAQPMAVLQWFLCMPCPALLPVEADWGRPARLAAPRRSQGRQIDPRTFPEVVLNGSQLDLFHLYRWARLGQLGQPEAHRPAASCRRAVGMCAGRPRQHPV